MITLEDLQLHLDNMYDQLDPDIINQWPVQGLVIEVLGRKYTLLVEEQDK